MTEETLIQEFAKRMEGHIEIARAQMGAKFDKMNRSLDKNILLLDKIMKKLEIILEDNRSDYQVLKEDQESTRNEIDNCSWRNEVKTCIRSVDCNCESCFDGCSRKINDGENQVEMVDSTLEIVEQEDQLSEGVLTERGNGLNKLFTMEVSQLKTPLNINLEYISCERNRFGQSIIGFECNASHELYEKNYDSNDSLKLFDKLSEREVICWFSVMTAHVNVNVQSHMYSLYALLSTLNMNYDSDYPYPWKKPSMYVGQGIRLMTFDPGGTSWEVSEFQRANNLCLECGEFSSGNMCRGKLNYMTGKGNDKMHNGALELELYVVEIIERDVDQMFEKIPHGHDSSVMKFLVTSVHSEGSQHIIDFVDKLCDGIMVVQEEQIILVEGYFCTHQGIENGIYLAGRDSKRVQYCKKLDECMLQGEVVLDKTLKYKSLFDTFYPTVKNEIVKSLFKSVDVSLTMLVKTTDTVIQVAYVFKALMHQIMLQVNDFQKLNFQFHEIPGCGSLIDISIRVCSWEKWITGTFRSCDTNNLLVLQVIHYFHYTSEHIRWVFDPGGLDDTTACLNIEARHNINETTLLYIEQLLVLLYVIFLKSYAASTIATQMGMCCLKLCYPWVPTWSCFYEGVVAERIWLLHVSPAQGSDCKSTLDSLVVLIVTYWNDIPAKIYQKMESWTGVAARMYDHIYSGHLFEDYDGNWKGFASSLTYGGATGELICLFVRLLDHAHCVVMLDSDLNHDQYTYGAFITGYCGIMEMQAVSQMKTYTKQLKLFQNFMAMIWLLLLFCVRLSFISWSISIVGLKKNFTLYKKTDHGQVLDFNFPLDSLIGSKNCVQFWKPTSGMTWENYGHNFLELLFVLGVNNGASIREPSKIALGLIDRNTRIWCVGLGKLFAALAHKLIAWCSIQLQCTSLEHLIHLHYGHWHWRFCGCSVQPMMNKLASIL